MRRQRIRNAPLALNAILAWNSLGLLWLEMMVASSRTITHRMQQRPTPARLYGMGSEKVMAAMESSSALARGMLAFPSRSPLAMWNAWAHLLGRGIAPYHARAMRNARATSPARRPSRTRARP